MYDLIGLGALNKLKKKKKMKSNSFLGARYDDPSWSLYIYGTQGTKDLKE